jgi:hypothetical protein
VNTARALPTALPFLVEEEENEEKVGRRSRIRKK